MNDTETIEITETWTIRAVWHNGARIVECGPSGDTNFHAWIKSDCTSGGAAPTKVWAAMEERLERELAKMNGLPSVTIDATVLEVDGVKLCLFRAPEGLEAGDVARIVVSGVA